MPQVHFEIFRQYGRTSDWSLVEALDDREAPIKRARQLLEEGRTMAVRVVKETYQPETGDYLSLTIFEDGNVNLKKKNRKIEVDSPSPCFKPDDLYSQHARMTMGRILAEWLAHQKLTVTELLHSAKALEKLEATGTMYQHAIQKIAVAQASGSGQPVAQIIKQLDELATAAIRRVYKDDKRGAFGGGGEGKFAALTESLAEKPEAAYRLNGALTKYLASATGWDAKLQRLLSLMRELPAEEQPRVLLLSAIDSLVAEMLTGSAALADLLGPNPDLGHALYHLVELFLGTEVHIAEGGGHGINELARFFAKDGLAEARTAIAARILSELKGMKRLCPRSLDDEFKMLRKLANQLVRGQGKYLSHEDLIGAFTDRSKRLVTHEPLLQFIQHAQTPDQKVERLLTVEENIIGAENKRTLSTFILPLIGAAGFEDGLGEGALNRLKRLVVLQTRVLRSGFQELQKTQIAAALDSVAQRIEENAKLLASLEARIANPVERVQTLIKLFGAAAFTEGALSAKAKRVLLASLKAPGFVAAYVAQQAQTRGGAVDRNTALSNLAGQLEAIGIDGDDALRLLAA